MFRGHWWCYFQQYIHFESPFRTIRSSKLEKKKCFLFTLPLQNLAYFIRLDFLPMLTNIVLEWQWWWFWPGCNFQPNIWWLLIKYVLMVFFSYSFQVQTQQTPFNDRLPISLVLATRCMIENFSSLQENPSLIQSAQGYRGG